MTIITTQSRITYAGDNVTTGFPIPFEFFLNSDITAVKTAVGGGVATLVQNVDYTLSGAGLVNGGSATKTTPLLTGETLALFLNPPITQASHYISNSPFPSGTLENDIDRLAQISQRLQDQISRSIRAPDGDPASSTAGFLLPSAISRALTNMGFDAAGNLSLSQTLAAGTLSQASIGGFLYPQTAGEATASVTPAFYFFPPGDVRRYNPVGNGVADDTVPISNFIKVANASPGLRCYLEKKTYAISQPMPQITNGNVLIYGAGCMRHDVSSAITGTILKWIGAAGATMVTIAPIPGAGNQKIGNIVFKGIGFDCNQLANIGLVCNSIFASEIDVGLNEAVVAGLKLGVVATLGDAPALQQNKFTLIGTQFLARNGSSLQLTCTATDNVSLNHFWCDFAHTDVRAIDLQGSDNNDWWSVRCFKSPSGVATECVSVEGGVSTTQCTRAERFHYLSANLPMHVYGTGSFAFAANGITVYLDKENGTPDLSIDAGATAFQRNSTTPAFDTPWQSYTPVVTSSTGAFTTVSAVGLFLRRGKITYFEISVTCTAIGTAAGVMNVTIPSAEANSNAWIASGYNAAIGFSVIGLIAAGTALVKVNKYDGTFPIANGQQVFVTGFYGSA